MSLHVRAAVGALVLAVLFACLAAVPASAGAHADLLGTTPGSDEIVAESPDDITLSFSEDVSVALGGVKVFAPDGSRVDTGSAEVDASRVVAAVDASERGSYAVAWRVISADGHPVSGSFVFHVGERSGSVAKRRAASEVETDRAVAVAYGVARGVLLLGILVATGGAIFAALIVPGWRPRLARASLVVALLASLVAVVLDASVATGLDVSETVRASVLGDQIGTVYGRAASIRIVLLLVALASAGALAGSRRRLALVPFVVAAASLSLAGHAVAGDPVWARVGADMLHVLAACAWLGGLVQLVPAVRSGVAGGDEIRRYSNVAFASVVVLLVTGLYAAWSETGLGLDELLDTTYGRLLLTKSGLFLILLAFGAVNRRVHVPGIVRGEERFRRRLLRFVLCELVLLVAVIAATAWLVDTKPVRDVVHPELIVRTLPLDSGGTVQLIVDPAISGTNTIHVHVADADHKPDRGVGELQLQAANHDLGIHHLGIQLKHLDPGGWSTDTATLPGAGRWYFTVIIRRGEFDEDRVTAVGEIAPGTSK